jgi:quaternary ammonium compound-resistance protein SugE
MSVTRAWVFLAVAGVFEVVWAIGLKYAHGFTRPVASAITVTGMGASFWFLSQALRALPLGTAYAVWTGIGAVGTAILGMVLFHESRATARLLCIALIVVGIIGLRFTLPAAPE